MSGRELGMSLKPEGEFVVRDTNVGTLNLWIVPPLSCHCQIVNSFLFYY